MLLAGAAFGQFGTNVGEDNSLTHTLFKVSGQWHHNTTAPALSLQAHTHAAHAQVHSQYARARAVADGAVPGERTEHCIHRHSDGE